MSQSVTIRGNRPGLIMRKGRIVSVNKVALRLLGCPKNILFWHSPKDNTLLISADDGQSSLSFPVRDHHYRNKSGYQLENSRFLRAVQNCANWDTHATCAVEGKYLDTLGMVAFCLDNTRMKEENSYE